MGVKLLYGFSLVACMIALVLVAGGHIKTAERFFAPGGELERGAGEALRTPLQRARGTTSRITLQNLQRELRVAVSGRERVSARELRRELMSSGAGDLLRKPVERGGAALTVARGGTLVLLCSRPANYHCYAFDLRTQAEEEAYGPTLRRARAGVSPR